MLMARWCLYRRKIVCFKLIPFTGRNCCCWCIHYYNFLEVCICKDTFQLHFTKTPDKETNSDRLRVQIKNLIRCVLDRKQILQI